MGVLRGRTVISRKICVVRQLCIVLALAGRHAQCNLYEGTIRRLPMTRKNAVFHKPREFFSECNHLWTIGKYTRHFQIGRHGQEKCKEIVLEIYATSKNIRW